MGVAVWGCALFMEPTASSQLVLFRFLLLFRIGGSVLPGKSSLFR